MAAAHTRSALRRRGAAAPQAPASGRGARRCVASGDACSMTDAMRCDNRGPAPRRGREVTERGGAVRELRAPSTDAFSALHSQSVAQAQAWQLQGPAPAACTRTASRRRWTRRWRRPVWLPCWRRTTPPWPACRAFWVKYGASASLATRAGLPLSAQGGVCSLGASPDSLLSLPPCVSFSLPCEPDKRRRPAKRRWGSRAGR